MTTTHSMSHGEPDAVKVARPVGGRGEKPRPKGDTGASPPTNTRRSAVTVRVMRAELKQLVSMDDRQRA